MEEFKTKIIDLINYFDNTQNKILHKIAIAIVDKLQNGNRFYTIGTGHSHMIGEEFYARAGGLACINLIAPMELTLGEHPLKSTQIERIGDYAEVIIKQYKIKKGDIVMITSNSGRNAFPIEMALKLKNLGVTTIAFTNLNHSNSVTSRHKSKKRLFEICDYVIDNCGCTGDAMISIDGIKGKMGASSSIIGMYMAQTLSMLIANEMNKRKIVPPVFLSANIDEGDEWNNKIMEKYYNI